jgi:hypothetical protein
MTLTNQAGNGEKKNACHIDFPMIVCEVGYSITVLYVDHTHLCTQSSSAS